MTQVSAEHYERVMAEIANDPRMDAENVSAPGAIAVSLSRGLLGAGAAGLAVTFVGGFVLGAQHALAAYIVAVGTVLSASLGALILLMVFHLVNAGWVVTARRQFENLASLAPVALLLMLPALLIDLLVTKGAAWEWMNPEVAQTDYLVQKKAAYLNPTRLLLFFVIYLALWSFLSARLRSLSLEQDRTGDRWLTNKARFLCAWGLPLTALTVAFAAFDFFMSIQPHFFSTMWGVYVFAGAACASVAIVILTFCVLQLLGRARGLVTEEHYHDLGKLLFAFSCFWAYIAFSQYFLIWYSNIPEETFWMLERTTGVWKGTGVFLAVGHFVIPFLFLLPRGVKRRPAALAAGAVWVLLMHVLDYIWIVRPILHHGDHAPTPASWWLDAAALVGVLGVFFGLYVIRLGSAPLTPMRDPRLPEAMTHKNYV
jgi:hypothetical protein